MLSCIALKKHWSSTLQKLDLDIRISEVMQVELFIELPDLRRKEYLIMKTAARTCILDEYKKISFDDAYRREIVYGEIVAVWIENIYRY